jgi:hypothetical protein
MIISGSLKNGNAVYRKAGKYPYHVIVKCPYRKGSKSP